MVERAKPKRVPRSYLRFGINTLLMSMTLLATIIAAEKERYHHRSVVEESFKNGKTEYVRHAVRFPSVDESGFLASSLTKLVGARWNEVVTSVSLSKYEMDEQVFDSATRLLHLQTLGLMRVELSESQFARLAEMKSLRWLYLIGTNVDQATIESLRRALPNTFVTGFEG